MRGNHLFELFRAENAEKLIPPHLAGNHLFEFFRAENAEMLIPPHLGSSLDPWSPVWGNHLFELFTLKMPKS